MKNILFFILFVFCSKIGMSQINDNFSFNAGMIEISEESGYNKVKIQVSSPKESMGRSDKLGYPDIPFIQKRFLIPANVTVNNISINSTDETQLTTDYNIMPCQMDIPLDNSGVPEWIAPNQDVYNSDELFPANIVEVASEQSTLGYKIVTVNIYPLAYRPLSNRLIVRTNVSYTLYFTSIGSVDIAERVSSERMFSNRKLIQSVISNTDQLDNYATTFGSIYENSGPLDFTAFPSSTGTVPDEIIITSEEYVGTFSQLADYRTKRGWPTMIITVSEICNHYQGVDVAERIFNYLKDVYNKYGQLYILLGGDVDIIPARYAFYDTHQEVWRPTDLYYSDVYKAGAPNYNWNGNGNSQFGEASDGLDLGTDHYVGRMTFNDNSELERDILKIINYEKSLIVDPYYTNMLFMAAFIATNNSTGIPYMHMGCDINSGVIPPIQASSSNLSFWRLYDDPSVGTANCTEFDEVLNKENALNDLSDGGSGFQHPFHFIYHMDHSSAFNMSVSSKVAKEALSRNDIGQFDNSNHYQIFYTGGCSPNSFDFEDGISEYYFANSNGGTVAFIGSTATSWGSDYIAYKYFSTSLFSGDATTIGQGVDNVRQHYTTEYKKRLALIGDPALQVWTQNPQALQVACANQVYTGEQTMTVIISGLGLSNEATLCLYKNNEVYLVQPVTGTGNDITVNLSCTPNTPGEMLLTVTGRNYTPVEKTIVVIMNPGVHLYVSANSVNDDGVAPSNGNNNEQIDAGEIIELTSTLSNQGLTDASGISASINTTSSYLTISQLTSSYGAINAQGSSQGTPSYVIQVSPTCPDLEMVDFNYTISAYGGLTFSDDYTFEIHAPTLALTLTSVSTSINNDNVIDPGDHVSLFFTLYNSGSGTANDISGTIISSSAFITGISTSTVSFDEMVAYSGGTNAIPFEFDVVNNYLGESIELTLTLHSALGQQWVFPIILDKPTDITGLKFTSTNNSISPYWDAIATAKGYNIYRSDAPNGPFSRLNSQIIQGFSGYTDSGLPELTTFYYEVSAVSQSGVEGNKSGLVSWTTLPYHSDWPATTISIDNFGTRSEASPMTYDVDGDGTKEIFVGLSDGSGAECSKGALFGFYNNMEELYDIDNNVTEVSGFYKYNNAGPSCTPAIADINNDLVPEVVTVTKGSNSSNDRRKIFIHSVLDGDNDNKPDLLWTHNTGGPDFKGVALADIDNNGTLEIVQKGGWPSSINIFQYDQANGTWDNYPGWPLNIGYPSGGGMPVACDIDNAGEKEIIIGYNSATGTGGSTDGGIYIYRHNGVPFITGNTDGLFFKHLNNGEYDRMDCVPVLAYVNDDEYIDMVFVSGRWQGADNSKARIFVMDHSGSCLPGWGYDDHIIEISTAGGTDIWLPSPSLGDVDGDGHPEICIADKGKLYCWKRDGTALNPAFPVEVPGLAANYICPLLADVDGDEEIDIVVASNSTTGGIYAFNASGENLPGWPLPVKPFATPVIDDIDNDGLNEIIASQGKDIYVWDCNGKADRVEWGKYRHDHYNSGIYGNNACAYYPSSPLVITGNTEWTANKVMNRDIEIAPGARLTIRSAVSMPENAKIVVKPGAKLVISGGSVTNACEGPWQGIEVWGNKNANQWPDGNGNYQQGYLELNNARLENAVCAVSLWKPDDYAKTGGILKANNTVFRNNTRSIHALCYKNSLPSGRPAQPVSFVRKCSFSVDADYRGTALFYKHIDLNKINGFRIVACDFSVQPGSGVSPWNQAIGAYSAYFTVNGECKTEYSPCGDWDESIITGFNWGIFASTTSSDSYPFSVNHAIFNNNATGVYMSVISGAAVHNSTFGIGENSADNALCETDEIASYGIDMNYSSQFSIMENSFTKAPNAPAAKYAGIRAYQCPSILDIIYKNTFTNLSFGNYACGINRSVASDANTGIRYLCNQNVGNAVDFKVADATGMINGSHMSGSKASGNTFSNATTADNHFVNEGVKDVEWYYYDTPDQLPTEIAPTPPGPPDFKLYSVDMNTCPTLNGNTNNYLDGVLLSSIEKMVLIDEFASYRNDLVSIKTIYDNLKDGGDTQETSDEIDMAWPEDMWQLVTDLLSKSPHLSHEILVKAAEKTLVIPQSMLFEILAANPDELKNSTLITYLREKEDPLPEYMILMLQQLANDSTYKTVLLAQINSYKSAMMEAGQKLVRSALADSIPDYTSARAWLSLMDDPESDRHVANLFINEGKFDSAHFVLDLIPSKYNLDGAELSSFMDYRSVLDILLTLDTDGRSLAELTTKELDILVDLASNSSGLSQALSQNVLSSAQNQVFRNCFAESSLSLIKRSRRLEESCSDCFSVTASPNPASSWVVFRFNLPPFEKEGVLAITDLQGKILEVIELQTPIGEVVWDARKVASGLYFYSVTTCSEVLSGKLIIE